MMRRILTLGVSAMALAALVVSGAGCAGGDDDDDDGAAPGGYWYVIVTSNAGLGNAAFFESFDGDAGGSFRDIPLDQCIDPLATGTGAEPVIVYEDVGTTLTAVSGASTLTYNEDTTGGDITYNVTAPTVGAPDDATYDLAIDGAAFASVDVPGLPFPITASGTTASWSTMGADETYVLVVNLGGTEFHLCRTGDDGSYNFAPAGLTSGFIAIIGVNYAQASHTNGDVDLITQANYEFDTDNWVPFSP